MNTISEDIHAFQICVGLWLPIVGLEKAHNTSKVQRQHSDSKNRTSYITLIDIAKVSRHLLFRIYPKVNDTARLFRESSYFTEQPFYCNLQDWKKDK